jgi:sulfate adenylyltransferase
MVASRVRPRARSPIDRWTTRVHRRIDAGEPHTGIIWGVTGPEAGAGPRGPKGPDGGDSTQGLVAASAIGPAGAPEQPLRVLFVCTANICRSAYAEVLARHLAGAAAGVTFASAGTYGLPAHPMNPDIAEFLPPGASADGFVSRRLTGAIVEAADLILTAEAAHRSFVLEEFPAAFRRVLTLGQFAEAVGRSELRGRALLAEVAQQRPPARPEHDVADPYRRGREANARAAAQLTSLLEVVVPALVATAGR